MNNVITKWFHEEGIHFLKNIGIEKGQHLLDFGCGSGYYTIPAAKIVNREGKVYALDKDWNALNELIHHAEKEGLQNIVPIPIIDQSEVLDIGLVDESIDVMLFFDVLHYIDKEERECIYKNAYKLLKKEGWISVFPKHCKSDMPLWNLENLELENIVEEIENENFTFKTKYSGKLIHDEDYEKGIILIFTKK